MNRKELLLHIAKHLPEWPQPGGGISPASPDPDREWRFTRSSMNGWYLVPRTGSGREGCISSSDWRAARNSIPSCLAYLSRRDAAWAEGEERIDRIAQSDASGDHYAEDSDAESALSQALGKQPRYQDAAGDDWIDEFARTATPEEFRGAMRFTVGKYLRRIGKKDSELSEVRKMRDYCQRWEAYLMAQGSEQ